MSSTLEQTKNEPMMAPVLVTIFAMPLVACESGKTWKAAADMIARRLTERYGDGVRTEFIEIFTPVSFDHPEILDLIQKGLATPPIVTLNGNVIMQGQKLAERVIRREIEKLIVAAQ